jgi:hypothetical protein
MEKDKTLEELATELLEEDAKSRGTTLYRLGIIDRRRRRTINSREIPLSKFEKKGL